MVAIANKLESRIKDALIAFEHFSETDWSFKANSKKWSRKEILGHLIDSAQNNIQRVVRAQQTNDLHILYSQNHWVAAHNYQAYPVTELQLIWFYNNKQFCHLLENVPVEKYQNRLNMGSANAPDFWTLERVVQDYMVHLEHHLKQIVNGE
jgi:HPt (histidine-containing phosphotransfer) domain-containing protein